MEKFNYRKNRAGGISCDVDTEEFGVIEYALSDDEIKNIDKNIKIKEFTGTTRKPDKQPF